MYVMLLNKIFFVLLASPAEDLGFVTFDVPQWQLVDGLSSGRFSAVFSCRPSPGPSSSSSVNSNHKGVSPTLQISGEKVQ